jgi:hypothetical protein
VQCETVDALRRIDPQRVVLAHPQLPAAVAEALGIARLEDAVLEVLDDSSPWEPLDAIQVPRQSSVRVLCCK